MDTGPIKLTITSGCSFTDSLNWQDYKTWPKQLPDQLGIKDWVNEGRGGQANNMIRMRVIHAIEKALETYTPQELLVGIMWSGPDRRGIYYHKDFLGDKPTGKVWIDSYNFIDKETEGVWKPFLLGHSNHENWKLGKLYYKNFHDSIGALVDTLHDIHYTQLYLKNKGINYFMSNAWNIFEFRWDHWGQYKGNIEDYRNENIGRHNALNHPDLKWIADSIDWGKFLPVEGMWEWCQLYRPDRDNTVEHHPTAEEHREFTKQVILPYIEQL